MSSPDNVTLTTRMDGDETPFALFPQISTNVNGSTYALSALLNEFVILGNNDDIYLVSDAPYIQYITTPDGDTTTYQYGTSGVATCKITTTSPESVPPNTTALNMFLTLGSTIFENTASFSVSDGVVNYNIQVDYTVHFDNNGYYKYENTLRGTFTYTQGTGIASYTITPTNVVAMNGSDTINVTISYNGGSPIITCDLAASGPSSPQYYGLIVIGFVALYDAYLSPTSSKIQQNCSTNCTVDNKCSSTTETYCPCTIECINESVSLAYLMLCYGYSYSY